MDSNRAAVLYLEEVAWGVTPSAALTFFRLTGESLEQPADTGQSAEIRADRQVADIIRTAVRAAGGLNWELSFGAPDDFLEGWFMNDWPTTINITGTINVVAGNKFSTTGGAPSLAAVQVGQWIKTAGFANAANNGYFKVTVKSTAGNHELTVTGGTLVVESGTGDENLKGTCLFPGSTFKSYSIEKQFQDSGLFDSFTGMVVGGFGLSVQTNTPAITGSFTFLGKKGADTQTVTIGTGGPVAAPIAAVMNPIDHVGQIYEAGVILAGDITNITLQGDNNLRARQAIRNVGAVGIGLGLISISGTLQAYFASRALLNKFRQFTETSLAIRFTDLAGNAYILDLEGVKFTAGPVTVPGQSQDVMVDLTFQAKVGATSGKMIGITRFAA